MWALLLLGCTSPPTPRSVVWVSLDTTRADRLAVYGGPAATPTLDRLAAEALVYEEAYSHFPETGLSHWAMLTGVLPESHGNVPAAGDSAWTGPTAAELARLAGLATGAFVGGVTLRADATGLDRGFDVYDDQFPLDREDMKRPATEVVARARAWREAQAGPTFTFVHLFDAHFPYTPAVAPPPPRPGLDGREGTLRPYRDGGLALPEAELAYVRELYDAELTELDAALAPLLDGLAPETVVVVTADHGESFEHGYLFNHRASLADGVMHVPLIVRVPGVAAARLGGQVGLVDLLPTVAAAAGWTLSPPVHGRSVLPPFTPREVVWARTDPWLPGPTAGGRAGPLLVGRTPTAKAVWGEGAAWGFDLVADPGETTPGPLPAGVDRADYAGEIARVAARTEPVPTRRAPPPREAELLEALGYVAPSGAPAPPPGAPAPPPGAPQGVPPGTPPGAPVPPPPGVSPGPPPGTAPPR